MGKAQAPGIIRSDITPAMVCDLYDFLRIDTVQRWLALPDEYATAEEHKESYNKIVDVVFRG